MVDMIWALILVVLLVWFVVSIFCPPLFGIERVEYLRWLDWHKARQRQLQAEAAEERREAWERGDALGNWKPPPLTGEAAAGRAAGRILRGEFWSEADQESQQGDRSRSCP
jgi:hypothetical protein